MKTFELKGTTRPELGRKSASAARANNAIPCVIYGGSENSFFEVTNSDVRNLIYTPNVYIVNLSIDGKAAKTCVVKEIQFHPVTDKILHIDFLEISEKKDVVMEIPVKLNGLAEGVKAGGKLSLEMRKLKVKGIYTKLPDILNIDVTNLQIGKTIQVGALSFPDIQILNAKNAVVAAVKMTRAAMSNK